MSEAISGSVKRCDVIPGYRFAHPGYDLIAPRFKPRLLLPLGADSESVAPVVSFVGEYSTRLIAGGDIPCVPAIGVFLPAAFTSQ
jgi:hypothetical protein